MHLPIQSLDFELTTNNDVTVNSTARSARVLVRWQGVPLGILSVPVTSGHIGAREIRRRSASLLPHAIARELVRRALLNGGVRKNIKLADHWHELLSSPSSDLPKISVAVCTRDRPDDLSACLKSIADLSAAPHEVLVIDNAPTDDATERLVKDHYPQFRYVLEPQPGLDHARNRAVREATGEVIAFTDDDVVVDCEWTVALGTAFAADPLLGLVTGLIEPVEQETPAQAWFEQYGGFSRGCVRHYFQLKRGAPMHWSMVGAGQLGAGANMAMRRAIFAEIGLFDPALDVGTPTRGGGDHEIFFRLLRSGWICLYEPTAVVRHRHRRTMEELRGLLFNYGYATRCFFEREMREFPSDQSSIKQLTRWWWRHWALERWLRSAWCPCRFPLNLVTSEIRGFIKGRGGYQRSRKSIVPDEAARPDAFQSTPHNGTPLRKMGFIIVDIEMPLHDVHEGMRCEELDLIVRWHGHPLGRVRVPTMGNSISKWRLADTIASQFAHAMVGLEAGADSAWHPRPAWPSVAWAKFHTELANILRPEEQLDSGIKYPSVTIIVATCNRPTSLRRCLQSLMNLRYNGSIEVVVVDNRPRTNSVEEVLLDFPGMRLVLEHRAGSSYARNAGVSVATGSIIAMTDDDMLVAPDWLEHLIKPFLRTDVLAVTGNTLAATLETTAEMDFEKYGGFCRGFRQIEFNTAWLYKARKSAAPTWMIGGSGNVAFRASIFSDHEVGPFLETLGAGVPAGVGEDTMIFYQILRSGGTIIYEPAAIAWHHHRVTRGELQRQIFAYSKGHVAYHLITLIKYRDRRALTRILVELPLSQMRRSLQRLCGRSSYPLSLIGTEIAGTLLGPWALWRSHCHVRRLGPGPRLPDTTSKNYNVQTCETPELGVSQ